MKKGNRYKVHPLWRGYDTRCRVFTRRDIGRVLNPKKRRALWDIQETSKGIRVFLTCSYCCYPNDVGNRKIRADGFFVSTDCVTCRRCHNHFWACLEGWKGRCL